MAGLSNCNQKPVYRCGMDYSNLLPHIDSKVVKLERIAVADTTIASVFGKVLGRDSSEAGVHTDTLWNAVVVAIDQKTKTVYAGETDSRGKYLLRLPIATYDLKVIYEAYSSLMVKGLRFGTGDMVEFNALLGRYGVRRDSTVYVMYPDKSLRKIE